MLILVLVIVYFALVALGWDNSEAMQAAIFLFFVSAIAMIISRYI